MLRKVETNVITYFSYNIVTSNHVYGCTTTYALKILLFHKSNILTFHLCGDRGHWYVDQKVNTCWLKFQISKYTLSAFCSYFYGFQNPSGCSKIVNIPKNVQKVHNPCQGAAMLTLLRDIVIGWVTFHRYDMYCRKEEFWDTSKSRRILQRFR